MHCRHKASTYVIDGKAESGVFAADLTLAEVRQLRAKQRWEFRDHSFDGRFGVVTFEEFIDVALAADRAVGIYPGEILLVTHLPVGGTALVRHIAVGGNEATGTVALRVGGQAMGRDIRAAVEGQSRKEERARRWFQVNMMWADAKEGGRLVDGGAV